jgi:hypothetical protein
MTDTDGAVPRVGSQEYKKWVEKAVTSGFLRTREKVDEIPDFEEGMKMFGSEEKAGFLNIYRKQCARCHIWGEGRNERGNNRKVRKG